ncbi:hypothetical protein [Sphingomonas crocodyli]|uniref:Glycosyltransferase RgtA/B/C/D-like domain-containing protein n=1 Tax=Sphingomonas crocodyli TaxID=1979270 RepID=A0A437LVQ3_9SPHN|nr:hypothetical protein [Sphingomonas crocodyli]RVT89467.1 hypothetical protein EOD43_22150 [Sphingomonas crocodyli]
MAMVNYPMRSIVGLFDPLPYYSQAAPPLFNLLCSAAALLPPVAGRLLLALFVMAGLFWAVARAYGPRLALPAIALLSGLVPALTIYATELKFYGLEMAGVAIIIAWFLTKSRRAPFGGVDVLILAGAMICGLSSVLIAGITVALWAGLAFARRRRLAPSELAWAALLALLAVGYYALIQRGTTIQMHNFPNAYGLEGIDVAKLFSLSIYRLFGNRTILIAIVLLINLADYRSAGTQKLFAIIAAVLLVCAILAAVGLYPAIAPRHVAWANAFALMLVANALRFLIGALPRLDRTKRIAVMLPLAGIAVAATGVTAIKATTMHFTTEDNGRLVAWLAKPRTEPIGLWAGTQPVIEYYSAYEPAIKRNRYFGTTNRRSARIPNEFLTEDFLDEPHDEIGDVIEARRDDPGGYDLRVIYLMVQNDRPPADALIAEAPRDTPFFIATSHADWESPLSFSRQSRTALVGALDAADCSHALELQGKEIFVLKATCPAS